MWIQTISASTEIKAVKSLKPDKSLVLCKVFINFQLKEAAKASNFWFSLQPFNIWTPLTSGIASWQAFMKSEKLLSPSVSFDWILDHFASCSRKSFLYDECLAISFVHFVQSILISLVVISVEEPIQDFTSWAANIFLHIIEFVSWKKKIHNNQWVKQMKPSTQWTELCRRWIQETLAQEAYSEGGGGVCSASTPLLDSLLVSCDASWAEASWLAWGAFRDLSTLSHSNSRFCSSRSLLCCPSKSWTFPFCFLHSDISILFWPFNC